jgi:predicted Zn-dependent protease
MTSGQPGRRGARAIFTNDSLERFVRGGLTQESIRLAQFLDQRSNSAVSRLAVAVALGGYGANADTQQLMAALFKERPSDTALLRGLAELAMNANLPLEAVRHLERLVQLDPANVDAKWFYGEALLAANRSQDAFTVIAPLQVKSVGEANLLLDAAV